MKHNYSSVCEMYFCRVLRISRLFYGLHSARSLCTHFGALVDLQVFRCPFWGTKYILPLNIGERSSLWVSFPSMPESSYFRAAIVPFPQLCGSYMKVFPGISPGHFLWTNPKTFIPIIIPFQFLSNRNLKLARAPLKSQAQGTSLFTRSATNLKGCPKGTPW